MVSIEEFFEKFTQQLKQDPPKDLKTMEEAALSDWLARHFTLEELEVLRQLEDEKGAPVVELVIMLAFQTAGLPSPQPGR
jgi:hypothetical protein